MTIYSQACALALRLGIPVERAQRAVIAGIAAKRATTVREKRRLEERARYLLSRTRQEAQRTAQQAA